VACHRPPGGVAGGVQALTGAWHGRRRLLAWLGAGAVVSAWLTVTCTAPARRIA